MSALIIYDTKHGTVEECVEILSSKLKENLKKVKLSDKNKDQFNLNDYDKVIIGGSIHAGKIQKTIKEFVKKEMNELLKKDVGLFLCTLMPPRQAANFFDQNFPEKLLKNVKVKGLFGGAVYYEKMNFFERTVIRMITRSKENINRISEKRIDNFVDEFDK